MEAEWYGVGWWTAITLRGLLKGGMILISTVQLRIEGIKLRVVETSIRRSNDDEFVYKDYLPRAFPKSVHNV